MLGKGSLSMATTLTISENIRNSNNYVDYDIVLNSIKNGLKNCLNWMFL